MSLVKALPLKRRVSHVLSLIRNGMDSSIWSIKVFGADSFMLKPPSGQLLDAPTLQASHVHDVPAEFVADPFILYHDSQFFLFFEVMNKASGRGDIGLAISNDGKAWEYQQIVLNEPYHLSYPYVFKAGDGIYMLPETAEANRILLYKAKRFPFEWEVACELISGQYVDPSIFQYNGKWWMFTGSERKKLHLFYADHLSGPWVQHPQSPIISDNMNISRPGGRVIVADEQIYRYTQNIYPNYGNSVRVFEVKKLTQVEYAEEEVNLILSGTNKESDWNRDGMHHIDQIQLNDGQWLIAVDGHQYRKTNYLAWKLSGLLAKLMK